MTGCAVRGSRGFVPKEGAAFDVRMSISFHGDEVSHAAALKLPDESFADYVRAALREKLLRDGRK